MKRAWKIKFAVAVQSEILCLQRRFSRSVAAAPAVVAVPDFSDYRSTRESSTQSELRERNTNLGIAGSFARQLHRMNAAAEEDLKKKVSQLRDELVRCGDESENVFRVLEEKGTPLFFFYSNGAPFVELLKQLLPHHHRLALEVCSWRREMGERGVPMSPDEYAKVIMVAGRTHNVDLALEWFAEAMNKGIKTTSTYNALMGAYMGNGLANKCLSIFQDLKMDADCAPSIVTYNILISVYGRLMQFDDMEATFRGLKELNLYPSLVTYNNLIEGYVTAWMWDSMDKTFLMLNAGPVKPDVKTYLLMLRGYAHSGNLEKMEEMHELVKHLGKDIDPPLNRVMICAYVRSSRKDRVERIHALVKLIPEQRCRPWLNLLLIRIYAKEAWLEEMEKSIDDAFEHRTPIHSGRLMRYIVESYYRCNAVDRLSDFVKRAESAGWRIIRSLYHGMMFMYGQRGDLEEMENTLKRMENSRFVLTRKTYWILFNAYLNRGERYKAEKIIGLMYKNGYPIPSDLNEL